MRGRRMTLAARNNPHRETSMAVEDYFDFSQLDDEDGAYGHGAVECHKCGTPDLEWGKDSGVWRLYEDGSLHACPAADADEFEIVE